MRRRVNPESHQDSNYLSLSPNLWLNVISCRVSLCIRILQVDTLHRHCGAHVRERATDGAGTAGGRPHDGDLQGTPLLLYPRRRNSV